MMPRPSARAACDVFEAFDDQAAAHRLDRAPPGAREFEQADAERGEVFAQQRFARGGVAFGETQFEVACGDAASRGHRDAQQCAERAAEPALQRPGQACERGHRADAEPGRPMPWAQGRAVGGLRHLLILRGGCEGTVSRWLGAGPPVGRSGAPYWRPHCSARAHAPQCGLQHDVHCALCVGLLDTLVEWGRHRVDGCAPTASTPDGRRLARRGHLGAELRSRALLDVLSRASAPSRRFEGESLCGEASVRSEAPHLPPQRAPPYPAAMRKDPIERLLRGLYSVALYVLLPVTVYHLIWRGFRQREYFRRWNERYARVSRSAGRRCAARHAVGACGLGRRGERRGAAGECACASCIRDLPLLVTTITPTGSARVRALWGDRAARLPAVRPAGRGAPLLRTFPSARGADAGNRVVAEPVVRLRATMACRRTSSMRGCRSARCAAIACSRRWSAARCARCGAWARSRRTDAQRFVAARCAARAGASTWAISSSIRPCPRTSTRSSRSSARMRRDARSWIAASTHEGEEADVIALHRRLRAKHPDLLLLWAPRHPERFRAAVDHAHARGLAGRDASAHALAGRGRRCVRRRYARRADGVLCVRARRVRRRQPAADRRAQPAGTGGGRHRDRHRPAPAQLRRDRAAARAGAAPCASRRMRRRCARDVGALLGDDAARAADGRRRDCNSCEEGRGALARTSGADRAGVAARREANRTRTRSPGGRGARSAQLLRAVASARSRRYRPSAGG